jgi:hypothetical protein
MSEREQSPAAGAKGGAGDWREQTIPDMRPVGSPRTDTRPSGPRFGTGRGPAYVPGPDPGQYGGVAPATAPRYSTTPVTVRRPDGLASLLLILAGIAAGLGLLMRWLPGSNLTGWDLTRHGVSTAEQGAGELLATGSWQPLVVALGGGVLFVLGLLLVLPARRHRFLGVLALLVSLVAAAGVVVPLAGIGWDTSRVGTGFWFAVAVPLLGLLGALKAMLTGPRYGRP